MRRKLLAATLFALFIPGAVYAQETPQKATPQHRMQSFYDAEGKLFINQNQAYRFLLNGMQTEGNNALSLAGEEEAFTFPEGELRIQVSSAGRPAADIPVWVDGTPPVTAIHFNGGEYFERDGEIYLGRNAVIELKAVDNLAGTRDIFWALDENAFVNYTQPISGFRNNGRFQLYAYAVDHVGNAESIRHARFYVDVSPPEMSIAIEGPHHADILSEFSFIVVNASDNASGLRAVYTKINNEDFRPYSTKISLSTLENGEHTLYSYSMDNAGNVSDTLQYKFYLDKEAPSLRPHILGDVFTQQGTTFISGQSRISLVADDNKSGVAGIKYQINQGKENLYSSPFQIEDGSGMYSIAYTTADALGNQSRLENLRVYVDTSPPATHLKFIGYYSKNANGYTITRDTQVELDAVDLEAGVKQVLYKTGTRDLQPYQHALRFSETGNITLSYFAIDEVGNREPEQTLNLIVTERAELADAALPEKPENEQVVFNTAGDVLQVPDREMYIWLSTSPHDTSQKFMLSMVADSLHGFPFSFQPGGENHLNITAHQHTISYPLTVDGQAPKTRLLHPQTGFYELQGRRIFAPGVVLTLEAEDAIAGVKEINYSENGSRYQVYNHPLSGFYTEQAYAIRYFATDAVGNEEAVNTFIFDVDATPPITNLRFTGNYSGTTLSAHSGIKLEAVDNLAGVNAVYVQLNDLPPHPYTGEVTLGELGNLNEGPNTLYYYSVDNVGNTEQKKQVHINADLKGPKASISWNGAFHPKDSLIYIHPKTTLSLAAHDDEMEIGEIRYRLNGGTFPYSEPLQLDSLSRAEIEFWAYDVLANRGGTEKIKIEVDRNTPSASHSISGNVIESEKGFILGHNAEITLSARDANSGVASIFYSINEGGWQPYHLPVRFRESGEKNVSYYSVDHVGNKETPQNLRVIYDQSPPEVEVHFSKTPVQLPGKNIKIDTATLISISANDRESEVKSIEYRLNGGEFGVYFRPFKIDETGAFNLEIKVSDLLGNEKTQSFLIEVN